MYVWIGSVFGVGCITAVAEFGKNRVGPESLPPSHVKYTTSERMIGDDGGGRFGSQELGVSMRLGLLTYFGRLHLFTSRRSEEINKIVYGCMYGCMYVFLELAQLQKVYPCLKLPNDSGPETISSYYACILSSYDKKILKYLLFWFAIGFY